MTNYSTASIDNHENIDEADAKRVILMGKTAGGAYVPLRVSSDGHLVGV